MALNISLPQLFQKPANIETLYPVGSAWERDLDGSVIAFEVLSHALYEGETLIMLVEYQRWHNVWGWIGMGRADWLEAKQHGDGYELISYTNGVGVEIPRAVLKGQVK